jgi:hypothetical protein
MNLPIHGDFPIHVTVSGESKMCFLDGTVKSTALWTDRTVSPSRPMVRALEMICQKLSNLVPSVRVVFR